MLKNLYLLFIKFFKIGAFTFGGGYAMVSVIHTEIVDKTKWLTDEEMRNIVVIAQSTPGVLAVNMATFTGYKVAGFWGAVCAVLGIAVPPVMIVGIIALFFDAFRELKFVSYAFDGLKAGVVLLILDAAVKLNRKNKKDSFYYFLFVLSAVLALIFRFFRINPIFILIGAAVTGLLYSLVILKLNMKSGKGEKGEKGGADK
jgi:chromate transporter